MDGIVHFCFNKAALGRRPDGAAPSSTVTSAVFLDRDGTINARMVGGYVTRWADFDFLPGAITGLRELSRLPDRIIVISNQQAVARGLLSAEELKRLTRRFVKEVRRQGGRIDDVYYCPHLREAGCACRKPRPALLLRAAADWSLELSRCCMIGDSLSDVLAAEAAGCSGILIDAATDAGGNQDPRWLLADDFAGAVRLILQSHAAKGRAARAAHQLG